MVAKLMKLAKRVMISGKPMPTIQDPNFGLNVGENANIGRPKTLEGKKYISIGDNFYMGTDVWLSAYDAYAYSNQQFDPRILIGDNVFIGDNCIITAINKIIIEDGVEISHHVYISDHVHSTIPEENIPMRHRRLVSRGYVKIGAYTGVGLRSVIAQGVTIGKYCIVAPNSVVNRSFPDYSIIRGNPAILAKTFDLKIRKWVDPDEAMKKKYNQ